MNQKKQNENRHYFYFPRSLCSLRVMTYIKPAKAMSVLVLFLGFAKTAFAAVEYNLIQPLPGVQKVSGFPEYITRIIPFILGLAAVLALLKIVWAGIKYATSLGSDSTIKEAKEDITQAILGLVLAISSYLILNTINPELVNLNFAPTAINIEGTGGSAKTCDEKICPAITPVCVMVNNKPECIAAISPI